MRTDKYVRGFGDRLKQAIMANGITDAELSRRCGFTGKSAVYKYTALNQMPCAFTLARMAAVLNVSTDWLLGLKEDRK